MVVKIRNILILINALFVYVPFKLELHDAFHPKTCPNDKFSEFRQNVSGVKHNYC